MNSKKTENDYLEDLLRKTEDQEVPDWLKKKIMDRVSVHRPKLHNRLLNRLMRPRTLRFRPANVAVTLVLAAVAFWGGTLVSHRQITEDNRGQMVIPVTMSDNAQTNYLIGRGLLAGNQAEPALEFFSRAVELDPQQPEFSHWQGVAFWASGNPELERQSYHRSIEGDSGYLPSLVYLGHNYLESGNYTEALYHYQRALQQDPRISEALYNSALAYQKLNNVSREKQMFRQYLNSFRTGKWAYRAVEHLHQRGDYSFRSYRLGRRSVILNMEVLLDSDSPKYENEVTRLAQSVREMHGHELHMVFFNDREKTAARAAALDLRRQLNKRLGPEYTSLIRISWFDATETIVLDDDINKQLSPSLLIFTKPIDLDNRRNST